MPPTIHGVRRPPTSEPWPRRGRSSCTRVVQPTSAPGSSGGQRELDHHHAVERRRRQHDDRAERGLHETQADDAARPAEPVRADCVMPVRTPARVSMHARSAQRERADQHADHDRGDAGRAVPERARRRRLAGTGPSARAARASRTPIAAACTGRPHSDQQRDDDRPAALPSRRTRPARRARRRAAPAASRCPSAGRRRPT